MPLDPFAFEDASILDVASQAEGPSGSLPFTAEMLLTRPSGDLFGWSQNAGMGWNPSALGAPEFLILSTHGGVRAPDGTPIALGYHTGHWEVGLLVEEAAKTLKAVGATPFAAACTDPCDGRSQGTPAMFDSLPFRNDAAMIFGRLIRSLPTGRGVLGVATCDKGLPAMMMALAGARDLATVLVPGGVTLPPANGEDAARIQSIGARFAHAEITLEDAADLGCRACASPGGGCQFLGTAATSQVVGEALGLSLAAYGARAIGTADLARHGAPVGARAEIARVEWRQDARHPHPGCAAQRDGDRTRPSAARRTCCCTCRQSRTRPVSGGRPLLTGARSTGRSLALSTRCPTAHVTTRPCRSSWPAACRR